MSIIYSHDFASIFAQNVTETSDRLQDWVARNGQHSIFAVLQRLLPEVISLDTIRSCRKEEKVFLTPSIRAY